MATWDKQNTGRPVTADAVRSSIGVITGRIDNNENALAGEEDLDSISIIGGSIDDTPIGGSTPSTGAFNTLTASAVTLQDVSIESTLALASGVDLILASGGVTCDDILCDSIATDSKDAIKFDVISGSYSYTSGGAQTISLAHGKSTNIRGASIGYFSSTFNPSAGITNIYCDSGNVNIKLTNSSGSASGTLYITVYYI